jgi:ribokinase
VTERLGTTYRNINGLHFVVMGGYVADCFVVAPRLPVWGEDYEARSIRTSPGGKALNQAVALARMGSRVTAIGAVGGDGLGRDIMSVLDNEGIESRYLVKRDKAATPICICFVGNDGETSFVWHIDKDVAVTPEIVRAAEPALRRADGVLVTFEAPVPTIQEVIEVAHRCDAQVILQPAPYLADRSAVATLPWGSVDVLIPNEAEARAILEGLGVNEQPLRENIADALAAELGVPTVVVTLGASGCVTHSDGASHRYSAQQAVPVDTTGASDAFTATFTAHLVAGRPESVAVEAATTAAAMTIESRGGHESMPFQKTENS